MINTVRILQYTAYRYRTHSGKHFAVRLCDTPGHGVTPFDLHYLMDMSPKTIRSDVQVSLKLSEQSSVKFAYNETANK